MLVSGSRPAERYRLQAVNDFSVFGAANAYLGLRVGMTVSASIPAAVMTVAAFRVFRADGTILEANLVITSYSIHYTKLYEAAGIEAETVMPTRSPR